MRFTDTGNYTPHQWPLLAVALLTFLFMASTAHAQATDANGVFDPRGCEAAQTCQGTGLVETVALEAAQVPAPVAPARRSANRTVGMTGLVTMIVGVVMMAPKGDEYHLLGDTYCVWNDYRTVDYGSCNKSAGWIQAGLITVGAGAAMTFIGFRQVTVSPTLSPRVFGARASLQW
jgi:hypothetical protein